MCFQSMFGVCTKTFHHCQCLESKQKLGFACSMLGKSSKNILPTGGLMVMNPMGSNPEKIARKKNKSKKVILDDFGVVSNRFYLGLSPNSGK